MFEKKSKIYIAGHSGLVGSAIKRKLLENGYNNLILKTHSELDLLDTKQVEIFFNKEKPEYVFLAAAKVGGILANNTFPADFIYQNLQIQNNIIHQSYKNGVKKLLFLGSSCIYPRNCPQPMKEEYLLSGQLEPTNEPYAIAKIAGIKMCQSYNRQYGTNFIAAMPTNLFGPGDNYDLENSHVIPALLRKFHESKINNKSEVLVWGSGKSRREFMHVDDMADAALFLMQHFNPTIEQNNRGNIFVNIGNGEDLTISQLSDIIKEIVGYTGKIQWDLSRPDGTPQKLLDVSMLRQMGWKPGISLKNGLARAYDSYKSSLMQK